MVVNFTPDPNDFADDDENKVAGQGVTDTGKQGSGGLSTEDAEAAYQKAADEHFRDIADNPPEKQEKNQK